MARRPLRRSQLLLVVCVALAVLAGACGPGSSAASDTSGCDHWCGNGSASVTMKGVTATVTGGGCYDGGLAGVDIRLGDWQGIEGLSNYLMLLAYRVSGPTAVPTPTPGPSDNLTPTATGSINGTPFTLGSDTVITLNADGLGSFSGTDVNGYGLVKGTFTCG